MRKLLLATTALLALGGAANAAVVDDFTFQDHPGLLGNSQTFSAGGLNLLARGFTLGDTGTALFVKNSGGDENGIGLANDADHEIAFGKGFVQINLDGIRSKLDPSGFSFRMGSTTQGEGWAVYGSEDANPFAFTLLATSVGTDDETLHTLAGGYDNYNFFYNGLPAGACGAGCGGNVLLRDFDVTVTAAVPEPSTWAMMLLGFAGIVTMAAKRRRDTGRAFRLV